jgi:hypothetical protein
MSKGALFLEELAVLPGAVLEEGLAVVGRDDDPGLVEPALALQLAQQPADSGVHLVDAAVVQASAPVGEVEVLAALPEGLDRKPRSSAPAVLTWSRSARSLGTRRPAARNRTCP